MMLRVDPMAADRSAAAPEASDESRQSPHTPDIGSAADESAARTAVSVAQNPTRLLQGLSAPASGSGFRAEAPLAPLSLRSAAPSRESEMLLTQWARDRFARHGVAAPEAGPWVRRLSDLWARAGITLYPGKHAVSLTASGLGPELSLPWGRAPMPAGIEAALRNATAPLLGAELCALRESALLSGPAAVAVPLQLAPEPGFMTKLGAMLGACVLFSGFDFVGYNIARRADAVPLYRVAQSLAQLGITYSLYDGAGWETAAGFNAIWWTWGCDLIYYGLCELTGAWGTRGAFEREVLSSPPIVTWAGWTPYGVATGAGKQTPIAGKTLLIQAGVGLAVALILISAAEIKRWLDL